MQRPPPPPPRLSLLGRFGATADGAVLQLSGPAERLVAYLAVVARERPATRAPVAERLWPDSTPARAASSLRSVLWRLPRPRGRPLVVGSSTSVCLAEDVDVDLWEAEDVVARLSDGGDPTYLPDAAGFDSLHHDLLPEWHDDWLLIEQENHRQLRLHALERTAARLRAAGRYTDALTAGLGAVRAEPLRETAHRAVIEVHLAEGNHAEALQHYERYRWLLADELGLHPSPAIRHLVGSLLGRPADGARPPAGPSGVPARARGTSRRRRRSVDRL